MMFSESMESFGLYEDLSLFNGDLLLEDASEPAVVEEQQGQKVQDGLLFTNAPDVEEAPLIKASVYSTLARPQNGSNDLGLVDLLAGSPTQDLPDPFTVGSAWMDTKTDLLNLLTAVEEQQPVVIEWSEQQPQSVVQDMLLYPGSPEAAIVPQVTDDDISDNAASFEVIQDLLDDFPMTAAAPGVVASSAAVTLCGNVVYNPDSPTSTDLDILGELNEAGLEALLSSSAEVANTAATSMLDAPILSPVSADDVESLLSSNPPSPSDDTTLSSLFSSFTDSSSFTDGSFTVETDESCCPEVSSGSSHRPHREKVRPAPYSGASTPSSGGGGRKQKGDRRERKKEQNRTAALRYREKKRSQGDTVQQEAEILEDKNKELRSKVDSMTREIKYLKDLMADVYKARSKAKKQKSGGAS
jgi:hypothetical protein